MTDLSLTVTRLIPAPPERVYHAWLDPRMLARFMLPGTGMSVPEATSDARVGGRFRIVMRAGDKDMPHQGTYLELTPHDRIRFTWESMHSLADSEVTLSFAPRDGSTFVTLTHVKFASEDARQAHEGGWSRILQELATVFAGVAS
jgi:uncharacterized protein YndB with AHSA1/START domain